MEPLQGKGDDKRSEAGLCPAAKSFSRIHCAFIEVTVTQHHDLLLHRGIDKGCQYLSLVANEDPNFTCSPYPTITPIETFSPRLRYSSP